MSKVVGAATSQIVGVLLKSNALFIRLIGHPVETARCIDSKNQCVSRAVCNVYVSVWVY